MARACTFSRDGSALLSGESVILLLTIQGFFGLMYTQLMELAFGCVAGSQREL